MICQLIILFKEKCSRSYPVELVVKTDRLIMIFYEKCDVKKIESSDRNNIDSSYCLDNIHVHQTESRKRLLFDFWLWTQLFFVLLPTKRNTSSVQDEHKSKERSMNIVQNRQQYIFHLLTYLFSFCHIRSGCSRLASISLFSTCLYRYKYASFIYNCVFIASFYVLMQSITRFLFIFLFLCAWSLLVSI